MPYYLKKNRIGREFDDINYCSGMDRSFTSLKKRNCTSCYVSQKRNGIEIDENRIICDSIQYFPSVSVLNLILWEFQHIHDGYVENTL